MTSAGASFAERLLLPGSPFELIDSSASSTLSRVRTFRHAPASLSGLYRRAATQADQVYLHCGGQDFTFGEVLGMAGAIQGVLRDRYGVSPGERVALIHRASPEWIASFVAATAIGAAAVLIGSGCDSSNLLRCLRQTRCAVVIADSEVAATLARESDHEARGVFTPSSAGHPPGPPSMPDFPSIDPEQEAVIAFTTGSTSRPKAVVSSHRAVITGIFNMMLSSALAAIRERGRGPAVPRPASSPVTLLLSPPDHLSGYSQLLLMMHVGGRVALLPTWDAGSAVRLISRLRISGVSGMNVLQLREVLRTAGSTGGDISSLRSIGVHGQSMNLNLLAEISKRLPQARAGTGYGLTETNGTVCAAVGADLSERPGTCGPLVPSVEGRIVDDRGNDVTPGAVGEIWVRGAMLLSGYCDADGTPRSPLRGGWFATGDHGRIDQAGFLYLHDRAQDIVTYAGRKISLRAVEKLACDSHLVDEAAVLCVSTADSASRLVVAVVPRKSAEFRQEQVLNRLIQESLIMGCEVTIVELAIMPRLRSGKIDRGALRRQLECSRQL